MIDSTCCFVNNLEKNTALDLSVSARNVIAGEFDAAASDGYTRFLVALSDRADVEAAETLIETRESIDAAGLIIEAVVEKNIFFEDNSENTNLIKNCMVKCDGIIVYREEYRGVKFYSVNHYLLHLSTRVVLFCGENDMQKDDSKNKKKEIDDFFISHMLQKEVKKVILY